MRAQISPSGSKSRATPSCSATANACSKFERLVCVDTRVMSTMSGLRWAERESREEGGILINARSVKVSNSFMWRFHTCIYEWWHWITSRPSRRWWSCRTVRPRSRLWSAWTRTAASPWLSYPGTPPWRGCPRSVRQRHTTFSSQMQRESSVLFCAADNRRVAALEEGGKLGTLSARLSIRRSFVTAQLDFSASQWQESMSCTVFNIFSQKIFIDFKAMYDSISSI